MTLYLQYEHAIAAISFGGPIKTKEMCIMHTFNGTFYQTRKEQILSVQTIMAIYTRQKDAKVGKEETSRA